MGGRAPVSPLRHKLRAKVIDTILDAAEEVAIEAGIGGMTIGAVAERAGVAVGTLYNYFPNGDGIIAALFRARRKTVVPLIAAAARATKGLPFERRLRELVRRLLDIFEAHERFVRVAMLADRAGNRSRHRDTALADATVHALEQVMRDGARRRLFPANRASLHAQLVHNALRSLFVWPARGADDELIVETILRGVLG